MEMVEGTHYAELVGYTGHQECMEVRHCTRAAQVWDHNVDYGVGLGLGRLGYWIGNDRERRFFGRERADVERHFQDYLDTPVRWVT
jgi:hypothetical protein